MKSRPKYLLGKELKLISPWCVLQEGTQVIHTQEAVCSNTCGPSDTNKKMERAPATPSLTARVELTSVHCDPKYHFLERERWSTWLPPYEVPTLQVLHVWLNTRTELSSESSPASPFLHTSSISGELGRSTHICPGERRVVKRKGVVEVEQRRRKKWEEKGIEQGEAGVRQSQRKFQSRGWEEEGTALA